MEECICNAGVLNNVHSPPGQPHAHEKISGLISHVNFDDSRHTNTYNDPRAAAFVREMSVIYELKAWTLARLCGLLSELLRWHLHLAKLSLKRY